MAKRFLHGFRRDSDDSDTGAGATGEAPPPGEEPATHIRYDRGDVLLAPHVRDDGTLLFTGRTAKPGIYRYGQADGSVIRELVPESTLHDAESLGTLGRAPVTLEHPTQDVGPHNVDALGVGDVDSQVQVESAGYVTVRLAVRRADAIAAVKGGKHQLSPGYAVTIDATPGVHDTYGAYDAIQTRRRYNHLAIVDAARGGPDIRLRVDGAAVQLPDTDTDTDVDKPPRRDTMWFTHLLALLSLSHTDSEDVAKDRITGGIEQLKLDTADANERATKADAGFGEMKKAKEDAEKALEKMTGERDALQKKVDKFEAASKKDADDAARVHLDSLADVLKVEKNADADNATFAHSLAKAVNADLPDDATADYVSGILATVKTDSARDDSADAWGSALGARADGKPADPAVKDAKRDDDDKELADLQYGRYDAAFNDATNTAQ